MAGGAGTRFWPISTEEFPKQFQTLVGNRSLLQESFHRIRDLCPAEQVLVLTHEKYVGVVQKQLPEIPKENIIGEPERRDTAAAVALAALLGQHRFGDAVMLMLTSDHWIHPLDEFHIAIREMVAGSTEQGVIYTMGIRPQYPATAYGYLHLGERIPGAVLPHYRLKEFKEKPRIELAAEYVRDGGYLWNSGMFGWTFDTIIGQFEKHLPHHLEVLRPAVLGKKTFAEVFPQLERISVDFAILEKADDVRCLEPRFAWSDLGGWLALEPFLSMDELGNLSRGRVDSFESRDNLVFCENPDERVALLGVEGLIVVRAGATTLVLPKSRTEEVKKLLEKYPQ